MVANIAAPKRRPITDQAFMTDFLPTDADKVSLLFAERWMPTNVPPQFLSGIERRRLGFAG
jgi:hypothetical protein